VTKVTEASHHSTKNETAGAERQLHAGDRTRVVVHAYSPPGQKM
jgi:hypothetical protein